ncbi:hypothetical protein QKY98_07330 [Pseudomonas sp. HR1]|uniref:hypothetical protein n=1 Tax=Pseudomonas sp. HR1 TaxID=1463361 RepID=UPI0025431875|nr:hypothetical protein [Pseudomonas sp. HR1]MDK4198929.1 hypothetical protein [Pseudomonas sp. HR1]
MSAFSRWRLSEIRYRLASLPDMTASGIQIAAYRTPAAQNPQRPFVQAAADSFNRMASVPGALFPVVAPPPVSPRANVLGFQQVFHPEEF